MGRPLKMCGSAWQYLVDSVAGEVGQGADAARYHASAGTPPGRFLGRGLDGLGPSPGSVKEGDMVSPQMLHRMLAQLADPITGKPLGRLPSVNGRPPVAGFDMTFSPSKSVSIMWAMGDQATRTAIEEVLAQAASEVIAWAEDHSGVTRLRPAHTFPLAVRDRPFRHPQVHQANVLDVLYDRPVRELLVQAVADMPATFPRDQVVGWFRQHYPSVKPSTVTAHITAATVNSHSRHHYPSAEQHLIFQRSDRLLERYDATRHGKWDADGEPVPGTAISPTPVVARRARPQSTVVISSGRAFEEHARKACSRHFGVDLRSALVEIVPGLPHQFDLVSLDGRIVGDAKWLKNIAVPAAKWSVIAEYVWLLQHVARAETRFIVFGQDREVAERWLKRFRPLAAGVEFFFLADNGSELLPL